MNTKLRIDSLTVSNFRCFESLTIDFYCDLTVLVARNGQGKTAILDAIKVALGTFTNSFPYSTTASLSASDAFVRPGNEPQYPVSVTAMGEMGDDVFKVTRDLTKAKGRTSSDKAKDLTSFGDTLFKQSQKESANEDPVNLPILAFYGTGRLWSEQKYADKDDGKLSPLAESRFVGYDAAFSARSNYKFVKQWLVDAMLFMDTPEAQNTAEYKMVKAQLAAVKKALDTLLLLEGWSGLHYNRFLKDLAIVRDTPHYGDDPADSTEKPSVALPISSLSDGVRAVFAMTADIACRCAKLNRHLGERACEETSGIVLIDEVDLFLHPSWQQRIIGNLQSVFPNIQFIVTTHSPQVVSSVPKECVRIISNGEIVPIDKPTQGVDVSDILADIFDTAPIPQNTEIAKKLEQLQAMTSEGLGNTPEWEALYSELEMYYGPYYGPLFGTREHRDFLNKINGWKKCTD